MRPHLCSSQCAGMSRLLVSLKEMVPGCWFMARLPNSMGKAGRKLAAMSVVSAPTCRERSGGGRV